MAVGPMTDQEFAAWLQQHGGERRRKDATVAVDNPDPNAEAKKINQTQTTVEAVDGATIVLHRVAPTTNTGGAEGPLAGPAYEVIEQTTAGVKSADPGAAAADANAVELQRQREANAKLPEDQDPWYETNAERAKRAQDRINQQGADAEKVRQRQRQEKADADAEAAKNKPTISYPVRNGRTYKVTTYPDGRTETEEVTGLPAEADKPAAPHYGHDEGGDFTIATGSDGKPVKTYATTQGGAAKGEPLGAPPADFSVGNVEKNLRDYSAWLNGKVAAGELDQPTATRLMATRHQLAQTAISEQSNIASTAAGIYGHQSSASASRASTATSGFNQILQTIQAGAKAQPKGSDAAARAFSGLLQAQIEHVKGMGGGVPEVPAAVQPYLTIKRPDGTEIHLNDAGQAAGSYDANSKRMSELQQSVRNPGIEGGGSPSGESGDLPPAVADYADSRPTGNSFADTEMFLTSAGISPQAIEAARQKFLSAQGQGAAEAVGTFSSGLQMPDLVGAGS